MLMFIPPLRQRLEVVAFPCIAGSFWILAVLVHIKIQEPLIEWPVLGTMLLCCLVLVAFISVHSWRKYLGAPGILILATIASYLVISSVVSLLGEAELQVKDVLRQAFFLLVTLVAILGGRQLLERVGVDALLKWMLLVLTVSCAVITASPLLRAVGALPEYRIARATGTFSDPNDASFIVCLTVVLALALLLRSRWWPAYPALVLGYFTAVSTLSNTAAIVLIAVSVVFFLLNIRRLRQTLLPISLSAVGALVMLAYSVLNLAVLPSLLQQEECCPDSTPPPAETSVVADPTPTLADPTPTLADPTPTLADPTPTLADPTPTLADPTPTLADPTTTDLRFDDVDRPTPPLDEPTPALADPTPALADPTPALADPTPALADPTPTVASPVSVQLQQAAATVGGIRGQSSKNAHVLSQRIGLWQMGAEKALASPLFGNGLYQLNRMEDAEGNHEGIPEGVHNAYLMLIGEAGVIPLALFILTLFLLIRTLWARPISLTRDVIVVWTIVMAMFAFSFHHVFVMGSYNFFIGLACAMASFLSARALQNDVASDSAPPNPEE